MNHNPLNIPETVLTYPLIDIGDRYLISTRGSVFDTFLDTFIQQYRATTGIMYFQIYDIYNIPHIIRLNLAIAYSFNINERKTIIDFSMIRVVHLDNNVCNCSPSNLIMTNDLETWIDITDPEIFPNKYQISSEGHVRNKKTFRILSTHQRNGYMNVNLQGPGGNKQRSIHRLVATAFIHNINKELCVVNHIDGDKLNNRWWNLEWTSQKENTRHAMFFGLEKIHRGEQTSSAIITEDIARYIWLLLIDDENTLKGRPKTNGSPTKVRNYLLSEGKDISLSIISNIKSQSSWKYLNKENVDFINLQFIITEDIARYIWLLLIDDENTLKGRPKTNGSPTKVQEIIHDQFGINICSNIISAIKDGRSWKQVTCKLPRKKFNDLRCTHVTEDIARYIWLLLIDDENTLKGRPKTNGSPESVRLLLQSEEIDISSDVIGSIKTRRAWRHVTDKLPHKDFKSLHPKLLTEDIARYIWLLLIDDENTLKGRPKTNGSPTKVRNYLLSEGKDISLSIIKSIKNRSSWKNISI